MNGGSDDMSAAGEAEPPDEPAEASSRDALLSTEPAAASRIQRLTADCRRELDALPRCAAVAEWLMVEILRVAFYLVAFVAVEYLLHAIGLLENRMFAHIVWSYLSWLITGVMPTESEDLAQEAETYEVLMKLRPNSNMTICEMGSGDGALMALVGRSVMPGGHLVATAPGRGELSMTAKAAAAAGLGRVRTFLATDSDWAPGLPPRSCDVIYSRMVIQCVSWSRPLV